MSQILTVLVFILMCILGGLSSLYVVVGLPAVILYKIYRKITHGEPML